MAAVQSLLPATARPAAVASSTRRGATRAVRASAAPHRATPAPAAASEPLSRRHLLALSAALPPALRLVALPPAAAAATAVDWAAVRKDLRAIISDPSFPGGIGEKGPTLVRLAWHSSGTYDRMSKTGGSGGGTIRFKEELAHGANAGLDKAVAWLEPVHAAHPQVSYADIYTYAGAIAVEEMGGPAVTWRAGRVDAMTPDAVTPDGRLPEADAGRPEATAAALRKTFGRMGFSDRELVALSGAHALGRCHAENSGYVGPWQGAPTVFSNVYFKLLAKQTKSDFWTPDDRYKQPQFKDKSGTLMMLPSDLVLVQDDAFKKYVLEYAKDQELFYKDFSDAFTKLEELGTSNLVSV